MFSALYFDGSKYEYGAGLGCILINREGEKTMLACQLKFDCTNNVAEYEALVQGLLKYIDLNIIQLKVLGDSKIIVRQVRDTIHCNSGLLKHYQSLIQELTPHLLDFKISSIHRIHNSSAYLLTNVASKLIPSQEFSTDRFSIELIFRPSIPDNITNCRVFNNDSDIIYFFNI